MGLGSKECGDSVATFVSDKSREQVTRELKKLVGPRARGDIGVPPRRLEVPKEKIAEFCRRWKIAELALFGSVLREDFGPESDIDVLVTFAPESTWSLFDLVDMQEELKAIFGREVDLVERAGLRNPFRKHEILRRVQVVYAI